MEDHARRLRRLHCSTATLQDAMSDTSSVAASSALPKTLAGILAEGEPDGMREKKGSATSEVAPSDAALHSSDTPEALVPTSITQDAVSSTFHVEQPHDRGALNPCSHLQSTHFLLISTDSCTIAWHLGCAHS